MTEQPDTQQQKQQYQDIELLSLQCVGYIKDFINVLRTIPEFNLVQHQSKKLQMIQQNPTIRRLNNEDFDKSMTDLIPLYTRIKETTSLCQNIQNLYITTNTTVQGTTSGGNMNQMNYWNIPNDISNEESSSSISSFTSERTKLLHYVLLPLVATLGLCYEVLDQIPTLSISPPSNTNTTTKTGTDNKKKLKPIPPIGMLSLQNYTDIACLIEFIICTCVVPMFPSNIILPINDRVRYHIPKSIAGRIPILSLLWSSKYYQQPDEHSFNTSSINPTLVQEWETIVCILGRLLLLDRFRPMLLPRHVTDIMAIILYRQEFCKNNCNSNNNKIYTPYTLIANCWIGMRSTGKNVSPIYDYPILVVDNYWRVKAYQTLLRNGRVTPVWIRKVIAQLLTQVATFDLLVLITVFVHEAVDQDYSAAALRLAHALVSKNTTPVSKKMDGTMITNENDQYFDLLCEQLVVLLDSCSLNAVTNNISVQNGATLESVWAVLDLLPKPIIDAALFKVLVVNDMNIRRSPHSNVDVYDSDLHKITRRLITLFSIVPSNASCVTNICHLFFKPLKLLHFNVNSDESFEAYELFVFGLIVRLATSQNILKSTVKDEAILCLNLFIKAMEYIQIDATDGRNTTITWMDVLVAALLRAVAPCSFESDLFTFDIPCHEQCQDSTLRPVQLRKMIMSDDAKMDYYVKVVEDRVRLIIRVLLMNSIKDADGIESNTVLLLLFQTLLTSYFCPNTFDMDSNVPLIFRDKMFRIVTMVSLPLICEECQPEVLLSLDNDSNIFVIMRIVIDSILMHCLMLKDDIPDVTRQQRDTLLQSASFSQSILNADRIAFPHFQLHRAQSISEDVFGSPNDDMIVSMTSVILGLLVSVLELGAKNRSVDQETILKSFIPDLLVIADSSTSIAGVNSNLAQEFGRIAELASLAAASIATRQVSIETEATNLIDQDSSLGYLQEAERDISSELPPIRARAMVQLRHRAVAISEKKKESYSIYTTASDDDDLFQILLLCMKALCDKESYVYLAAIHTIVAVADTDPSKFVRMIGIALVTGYMNSQNNGERIYEMNFEQRAKLTEALVFIVRRRNTFYPMLPFLIDLLVIGLKQGEEMHDERESKYIHDVTHSYFVAGTFNDNNVDSEVEFESSLKEYWKEVDIRVRTGGPLFQIESADVVRSGMVLVVSDLVSILPSFVTARYAVILISCCIDTLRLDASRPVRRAGATLARELYDSLVREQDEFLEAVANKKIFDVALSMAMVDGREEVLFSVLRRIVACAEHAVQINGVERLNDPALNARCQEAIALRNNADQGGILLAGKVALKAKENDDRTFVSRLLARNNNTRVPTPTLKIQEL